jgi:type II secretory pathway component GspD/PulD (secretin)
MKKFTKQIKILLKIMRFSLYQVLLILFCATFAIAHKNHGQECLNQKIVLHLENKPLDMALRQIKKNASVSFIYSPQLIGSERNVTIVAQNESIKNVLFKLLAP